MAYPFDLPEKRRVRVNYPLRWFKIRGIPVVDEQVQADTYLDCGILSEAINRSMSDARRGLLFRGRYARRIALQAAINAFAPARKVSSSTPGR